MNVPASWRGLTWLSSELARHPDLVVSQLSSTGAARARVQDGLARVGNGIVSLADIIAAQRRLDGAADLVSPVFHIRSIMTPTGPCFRLEPRDGVSFRFDLPAIEAQAGSAAADALQFGAPATFEGSFELFGIDTSGLGPLAAQWTVSGDFGAMVEVHLRAFDRTGCPLGDLRLNPAPSTAGTDGAQIEGVHRSGWFGVRLRVLRPPSLAVTAKVWFDCAPAAFPEDIAELLAFLDALEQASQVGLAVRVDSQEFSLPPVPRPAAMGNPLSPAFATLARAMADLQRLTNLRRTISINHEDVDPRKVCELVRLLQGEAVTVRGTLSGVVERLSDELLVSETAHALVCDQQLESIMVQDVSYPIGMRRRITCPHAIVANLSDVRRAAERGTGCEVVFKPADDGEWTVSLGPELIADDGADPASASAVT